MSNSKQVKTKICSNKNCKLAGIPQPIENFSIRNDTASGYASQCKECRKEYKRQNAEHIKQKNDEYREKNRDTIRQHQKEFRNNRTDEEKERYKEYLRKYHEEHRDERLKKQEEYKHSPASLSFKEKLEPIEECREDPENPGLLQVKCFNSNCRKWFNPTNEQASFRVLAINSIDSGRCGYHLYCCEECKKTCSVYKQLKYPKWYTKSSYYQKVSKIEKYLREQVLKLDNYTCQICGKNPKDNPDVILECHHIIPQKMDPRFSGDVDNCITLCKDCHIFVHTELPGCSIVDLRELNLCTSEGNIIDLENLVKNDLQIQNE